jgi:CP family cyanate transporter-like MFS transporter
MKYFTQKNRQISLFIGIIAVAICLRAPITAVGPLLPQIQNALGLGNAAAGMVTTVPLLAFGFFSIFAPIIAKKWGMESTILVAILLIGIGIVTRSWGQISFLYLGTIILSLGIAIGNVLLPGLVKQYFALRVGLVTAMYSLSMNIIGATASAISVPIASQWQWQGALACMLILALVALLAWLPQMAFRQKKQDITEKNKSSHNEKITNKSKINLWNNKLAWQVTFYMGLQSLLFYTLLSWLPHIMAEQGIGAAKAGAMLGLLQMALLPVAFVVPIIASKLKNQQMLCLIGGGFVTSALLLFIFGSASVYTVAVILMGIGLGFAFSLSMVFFGLRTNNMDEAAALSGMAQAIGYLMAAVGPMLFGWLHDIADNWIWSLWLLVIVGLANTVAGYFSGRNIKLFN